MRQSPVPARGLRLTRSRPALARAVVDVLEDRRLLANVSGIVFWDADGNGVKATMEAEIGGHNIYVDLNNNARLDAGEPSTGVRTSGSFSLQYLYPGHAVTLRRIVPTGWEATGPSAVTLAADTDYRNLTLGSRLLSGTGSITVSVFDDANANGVRDAGEGLLPDTDVYLESANDGFRTASEAGATTDAGGRATILNLSEGNYTLRVQPRRGEYPTLETTVQTVPVYDTAVHVTLGPGSNVDAGVAFGMAPATLFGRVAGFVYHDVNDNGKIDVGIDRALLSNRTVYADLNENGSLDANEPRFTTQVDGYSIPLPFGTYTLRQVLAPGWRQTVPADPSAGLRITVDQYGTRDSTNFATAVVDKPIALPGGPYAVNEGNTVTLRGSGTTAAGTPAPFTYEWDFDYDGQTFQTTGIGQNVFFGTGSFGGPTTRTVGLRVRDVDGIVSDVATTTVTVVNVAPTATFLATPTVAPGQPATLSFSDQNDPDPADRLAGYTYSYDLDGDRVYDIVDSTSPSATVPGANLTIPGPKLLFGRITDKDGGSREYVTSIQVSLPGGYAGTPFLAGPVAIAATGSTTVQVENFDNGGEGVAYHDTDAANVGGSAYRSTGVDLESINDGNAGVGVGYAKAGEWLKYSVNVAQAGGYDVGVRFASLKAGGSLHLEVDGVKVGNSIGIPDTGAWTNWKTVTLSHVPLPAGPHVLTLAFDTNGSIGYVGNFNSLTFTATAITPPPPPPPPPPPGYTGTPFKGTAATIGATGTSRLEVEDFDDGGEGVAYHDTDAANVGGSTYRAGGGVDLSTTTDGTSATVLSFGKAGEWLKYTVDVAQAGAYNVGFRVSSLRTGGSIHLEVDGVRVGGSITVPDTGAWTTWKTVTLNNVQLPAGRHVLTLKFDTQSSIGYVGNFNYLTFAAATVTPPPPGYTGTPFKGTPATVNASGSSTIEAENFDDGGEGVAYHDTDSANLAKTSYRTGGVDVEAINDAGAAGFDVGFAKAGEWLKYTVDVAADGTYDLDVRLASLTGGGAFHLEVDGVRLTPNLGVPRTGAWTTYANVRQSGVSLKAGRHVVRLVMDANGSAGYVANFNWMRFTRR